MQQFIAHAYKIECLTNLHVGSGDNNYGVIDKQVQRDSITNAPVIHASGLKGALREYYDVMTPLGKTKKLSLIFGSGKSETDNMQQGLYRFLDAGILSIPVRGTEDVPWYKATSQQFIDAFNRMAKALHADAEIKLPAASGNAVTEFGQAPLYGPLTILGNDVALLNAAMQKEVLQHLPVIARNSLDNGQSENLWYEEVVPRESVFYFFVLVPQTGEVDFESDFNSHLDKQYVQIGANATVGYGCCYITKII